MWKSLSIKTLLILILLIPVSGLVYLTIFKAKNSYTNYTGIENSIQNVNEIANFSEVISLISDERALYDFSKFEATKKKELLNKEEETTEWFSKYTTTDSIVANNIKNIQETLRNLRSNIENNKISSIEAFSEYTSINNILNNLIEREILNCETLEFSILANNFNSYVNSKETMIQIRDIVLHQLTKNSIDDDLQEFFKSVKQLTTILTLL